MRVILLFLCVIAPILVHSLPGSSSLGAKEAIELLQSTMTTYNKSLSELAPFVNYKGDFDSPSFRLIADAGDVRTALMNGEDAVFYAKLSIRQMCIADILTVYIRLVNSDSPVQKPILSSILKTNLETLGQSVRKIKDASVQFKRANDLIPASTAERSEKATLITTLNTKVNEAINRLDSIETKLHDDIKLIEDAKAQIDNASAIETPANAQGAVNAANGWAALCEVH